MELLIESTKTFENDLERLSENEKSAVLDEVNLCASLFQTKKAHFYGKLRRVSLSSDLNGYDSSLYKLKVSQKLRMILTIDEDPIFGKVVFTLFRTVKRDDIDKAYRETADFLYQALPHHS
ncbi:MAG: hypothetical protein GY862_06715 [Gammaproteobacteria bacterium]|nr:hypothetical protein [Gammaproteobacteria bacterium]